MYILNVYLCYLAVEMRLEEGVFQKNLDLTSINITSCDLVDPGNQLISISKTVFEFKQRLIFTKK